MGPPVAIAFERYGARRGALWLRQAYAMFAAQPLPWLSLLVLYYLVGAAVELVPVVGPHAALILKPVFEVGFLAAAWAQERGEVPHPRHLFQGFRANLWVLIPLGVILVAGVSLAVLATALVDGGTLLTDILSGNATVESADDVTPRTRLAMLFGIACAIPVWLAMWFAPALVVFQDCRTLRALTASLAAAAANWRAIALYALLVFVLFPVIPYAIVVLFGLLVPAKVAVVIVVPYALVVFALLHIADYVCYRDIFHAKEAAVPTAARPTAPPSSPTA